MQYIRFPNQSVILSGQVDSWTFDGSGNPITSEVIGPKRALDVNLAGGSVTVGGVGVLGDPVPADALQVGFENPSGDLANGKVSAAGELLVGSSTLATETTLTSIDGKFGTLGQKAMAGSAPVVIASDQTAVKVDGSDVTQPVAFPAGTGSAFNLNGVGQNAEITGLTSQDTWIIYVSAVSPGGTMMCFGSPDPSSVVLQSVPAVNVATGQTSITIDAVGLYRVNISGFTKVRLEVTALPSGNIAGIQLASYATGTVSLNSPLPAGSNIIGGVTQSGTWTVQPGNTPNTTPWLATINQGGNSASVTGANALKVDGSAVTQPVSVASAIPTLAPVNSAGNSPGSNTVSTVATLTAPANAVGFILMCLDTATANIRYRIGAAATTTSGQQLQAGRDTGFVPCGANISICAESGTQPYDIQWVLSS